MLARILLGILYTATGLAIVGTIVLHNHARITCHWNWDSKESFMRMVVFADPQMEGDAKIRRLGKRGNLRLFLFGGGGEGRNEERTDQATALLFFVFFFF